MLLDLSSCRAFPTTTLRIKFLKESIDASHGPQASDAGSSRAAYPSTEDSLFGLHSSMAAPAHGFATERVNRRYARLRKAHPSAITVIRPPR